VPVPAVPRRFGASGRKLWREVLGRFEFDQHELSLLVEACRTVDALDRLDEMVHAEGLLLEGKAHPALVEARLQRVVLTRILATLRLPEGESDVRPQRRGTARGAYQAKRLPGQLRGVS